MRLVSKVNAYKWRQWFLTSSVGSWLWLNLELAPGLDWTLSWFLALANHGKPTPHLPLPAFGSPRTQCCKYKIFIFEPWYSYCGGRNNYATTFFSASAHCSASPADQIFVNDRKGDKHHRMFFTKSFKNGNQCSRYPGELPSAHDLGRLVNLDNVRKTIGDPVSEAQKSEIIKDLESAVTEFIARETEAEAAAHSRPFVTVNNRTNIVAIHSRLLHALQLSVVKSTRSLQILPDSGAFDEVSSKSLSV